MSEEQLKAFLEKIKTAANTKAVSAIANVWWVFG